MKIKQGQKVTVVVQTPVATTKEKRIVESVTDTEIYIDGLKIPFDKKTLIKTECFPGSKVYLIL